ncbi:hypothetical protein BH09SUM1_BH09SUM1_31060 [soil metagenome]
MTAERTSLLFVTIGRFHFAFPLADTLGACEAMIPANDSREESVSAYSTVFAGDDVPVFDLRRWFGDPTPAAGLAVILRNKDSHFGIVVQSVIEAVEPDRYRWFDAPAGMTTLSPGLICGWADWEGVGAFVLNVAALEAELMSAPFEAPT